MTFQPFFRQTITIPTFGTDKAPSTLQIELYQPLSADSDYSVVLFWTIQSHLLGLSDDGIQGYVDLGMFAETVEKDSSIDL